MKLARPSNTISAPPFCAQPSPTSPSSSPPPALGNSGRVPGPQLSLLPQGRGAGARPRPHWACSEAFGGGSLASQRSHSAAGGRARGCSWSSSARSWSCRSFPQPPPPPARGSRSRRGGASGGQPAPEQGRSLSEPRARYGAVPGEEPRGLGRVRRTGTARAQTALQGSRGLGSRAEARPGLGGAAAAAVAFGAPGRCLMRVARSGTPAAGTGVGRRPGRCFQVGGRRERVLRAGMQLLCEHRAGTLVLVPPPPPPSTAKPGTQCAGRAGQAAERSSLLREKLRENPSFSLSPR